MPRIYQAVLLLVTGCALSVPPLFAQRAQNYEQRQAWETGCYNKQGPSCDAIAGHWDAVAKAGGDRGWTVEQAFRRKLEWAKRGCDNGGQYSCDALGWAHEHGQETAAKDPAAAHRYYRMGCDNGAYLSCNNYAGTFYYGFGVAQDRQRGLALYEEACQRGNPYACNSAETARRELGTEELHEVCVAGSSLACYRAAKLQSSGKSPNNIRATLYYARTCIELEDPHGCLLFGIFLSDTRALDDWQSSAVRAFEKACALGQQETCASLAETGTDPYWPMTFSIMKSTCRLGFVDACWSIVSRLSDTSWLDALEFARIGCELGSPELCHNAGVLQIEHPGVVGDPYYGAVQAFKAGCELGYQPSCDGQTYASNKSQIWRDVTFGSRTSGFEKFMSDLAKGLGQATSMGVPASARTVPARPSVSGSSTQDNRDFQNAINAINNIGTGYNATCPISNPYC